MNSKGLASLAPTRDCGERLPLCVAAARVDAAEKVWLAQCAPQKVFRVRNDGEPAVKFRTPAALEQRISAVEGRK